MLQSRSLLLWGRSITLGIALGLLVLTGGLLALPPTTASHAQRTAGDGEQPIIMDPKRLYIPSVGIDASVVPVGLDTRKHMQLPPSTSAVGWYRHGTRPGEAGSAVFAGHLDTSLGLPAVFWQLSRLLPGDAIEVTDAAGTVHRYHVTGQALYDIDHVPMNEIFASASGFRIQLITCAGNWDWLRGTYGERLVVTAEMAAESQNS